MGVLVGSEAVLPDTNEVSVAAVVLLVSAALIAVGVLVWVARRSNARRKGRD